jgi:predicted RNA-binding protein with PIN domain
LSTGWYVRSGTCRLSHATSAGMACGSALTTLQPPATTLPGRPTRRALVHASPYRRCVRWIVDGMNVIGTRPDGWWKNRRRAMVGLVDQLERWASAEGQDVTVVFEQPTSPPIRSSVIGIGHAPAAGANSADDEIVRLVRADDRPQQITVVTSDATLADRVRDAGASACPAASFRNVIDPRD